MQEVYQLLNRIKKLRYFEITVPVPPFYLLTGRVPFDITIENDLATCKVLAADIVEAERQVLEYFNKQV